MIDQPIGFIIGRLVCPDCGKTVFWNEDIPESRPILCPFCGIGLPSRTRVIHYDDFD